MCSAKRTRRSGKHLPDRVERIAQCVEHLHGDRWANSRDQPPGCTRWCMYDMRWTRGRAASDHHPPIEPGVVGSPLAYIGHQDITRERQPFVHQRLLLLVKGARRKGEQDFSGVLGHCARSTGRPSPGQRAAISRHQIQCRDESDAHPRKGQPDPPHRTLPCDYRTASESQGGRFIARCS